MRSVKVMLLGIGLILVGIFFRLWSISYVYSEFVVHHLPIAAVAAGSHWRRECFSWRTEKADSAFTPTVKESGGWGFAV